MAPKGTAWLENRRLAALNRLAALLAGDLDLERVLQTIVAQAAEMLQADAVALFLPNEKGEVYALGAQRSLSRAYASGTPLPVTAPQVLLGPPPRLQFTFGPADAKPEWAQLLLAAGRSRSLTLVGLAHGNGLVGLLALLRRSEGPLRPGLEELTEAFARQVTAPLRGALHHRETEYGAAESTFLLQIGQLLTSTFDMGTIAQTVVAEAADLTESDVCALYLYNPVAETIELRALEGTAREDLVDAKLDRRLLADLPRIRQAAQEGRPVAAVLTGEDDLLSLLGPACNLAASLTVPLRTRDSLLGLLFLGRHSLRPYSAPEVQMGLKLGALGALALDNSRLYANLGEQMQQLREAQAQLIEAEKMATVGRIVAGLAHELNNPLAIISGYAQMLLDGEVPPQLRDDLERIDRAARRAAQVVRDLLAFARQQPVVPRPLDMAALVRAVLEKEAPALAAAGIELELALDEGLPPVEGDPGQLEQVLAQLIAGACQAIESRPGAGKLAIAATYRERVLLSVADDGPAIRPDLLDKVFEPFLASQEAGRGGGLGPSMAYGVVRAHGGRIWAANNPTAGVTFYVELPAAEHR